MFGQEVTIKVTSTDIKNAFGKYLRLCSTEPVYITKNGVVIAKLLNHTEADEIIEDSLNLRQVFEVDANMNQMYDSGRVAEAIETYNLSRVQMTYEEFQKMNQDATHRYEYIDALRGVAILFIVFGHIPMFCYGLPEAAQLSSFRAFTSRSSLERS